MDVRNWAFLEKRLNELGTIKGELSSGGFAEQIAYTAFFWTLLQFYSSDDEDRFRAGAMSLPDYLTPANRKTIETICHSLEAWLATQPPDSHPQIANLRAVIEIGKQATIHPLFEPRKFRGS
jgi:hypothetical protein